MDETRAKGYEGHLRWCMMRLADGEAPDLVALEREAFDTLDALLAVCRDERDEALGVPGEGQHEQETP